jgi:hypothetical protein
MRLNQNRNNGLALDLTQPYQGGWGMHTQEVQELKIKTFNLLTFNFHFQLSTLLYGYTG